MREQYEGLQRPIDAIARELGTSAHTIWLWLHKHGIPARSSGEATKLSKNDGRFQRGEKHHAWRGGRYINRSGYVCIWTPRRRYVLEHRLEMERMLKRPLRRDEVVHHLNGDKTDNRPENLRVMRPGEHSPVLHYKARVQKLEQQVRELQLQLETPRRGEVDGVDGGLVVSGEADPGPAAPTGGTWTGS